MVVNRVAHRQLLHLSTLTSWATYTSPRPEFQNRPLTSSTVVTIPTKAATIRFLPLIALAATVLAMPPTVILPGHTYLHITSPLAPEALSASLASAPLKLEYRGPVGELEGEHVYEVVGGNDGLDGETWKRDGEHVLRSVRAVEGVKGAQELVAKQRAKRDEF